MAETGADIVFKIRADLADAIENMKAAEKAMEEAGLQAQKTGEQVEQSASGWEKFLGGFEKQIKSLVPSLAELGQSFANIGIGAITAFGAALAAAAAAAVAFTAKSVAAYAEHEEAVNDLKAALDAQGAGSERNIRALTDYAAALAALTGVSDEAIIAAQTLGLRINIPASLMPEATQAALNLSAAIGVDLQTAMQQIAQTMDGDVGRLRQLVPELGALTEESLRSGSAIGVLNDKLKDAAEIHAQSLTGQMGRLKTALSEVSEAFGTGIMQGQDFGAVVGYIADVIYGSLPYVEEFGRGIINVFRILWETASKTFTDIAALMRKIGTLGGVLTAPFASVADIMEEGIKTAKGWEIILDGLATKGALAAREAPQLVLGGRGGVGGSAEDALKARIEALRDKAEKLEPIHIPINFGSLDMPSAGAELAAHMLDIQTLTVPLQGAVDMAGAQLGREEETAAFAEQQAMRQAALDSILATSAAIDQQTAALQAQRDAWASLDPRMQQHIVSQEKAAGKIRATRDIQMMFTQAIGQTAAALIQWAITGEGSLKKILQATLTSLATEAGAKALMELAEGIAAAARHDPAAAGHFAAAKQYALVAAITGAGAAALGRSGGGEEEGRGRDRGFDDTGRSNDATREATQEPTLAGPRYSVVFTGNPTLMGGGTPQELAANLAHYLDEIHDENGGRRSTRP